jgi:hypothetical protein
MRRLPGEQQPVRRALDGVGGGRVLDAEIDDKDGVPSMWEVMLVITEGERRELAVGMTKRTSSATNWRPVRGLSA